ncbi:methionine--tRNA ligase [Patescibacteria group bacterium]|nr:methionine--tRNA ligase [Patescibacteria group bacterium]MDE1946412.1 methionine--tRNA ligase [Patescibacteria group bacterium]MDE2011021.1 methionine--tRNA ligase [Patescibacteria group bacterium]MDE2233482.1 methionine--tRNA ligase [Patescibacteria group bacterium]
MAKKTRKTEKAWQTGPEWQKPFYITTTLPYVNSDPHIGFAMEAIRADTVARAKKLDGFGVFSNTGTDEHGMKIYQNAQSRGVSPQEYVDEYAAKFKALIPALGLMPDTNFIRTTDPHHVRAAQAFWKAVEQNGYIYKKNYKVKYCVGCELEKTESELVDGKCPLHPLQELETIEEENYFFKASAFQKQLLELYETKPDFVIPDSRLNEIKSFVRKGLEDFSISRLASKMPWGIPVPDDDTQVMYVWFDALVNYISAVGWPDELSGDQPSELSSAVSRKGELIDQKFQHWWIETGGVVQYCGKDNLRQQAAMWQAMLMAAGLPNSRTIVVDGFITGDGGVKMSKSLGNTVDPFEIVKEYGTDALRYFVLRELHPFEDSPFTPEKFKEAYNAHLANGLGNLVSRVMKMAVANDVKLDEKTAQSIEKSSEIIMAMKEYEKGFGGYNIQQASNAVWTLISKADAIVQEREPFKKIKTDASAAKRDIAELLAYLKIIAGLLLPILPQTAETILDLIKENKMPERPLFVRK